MLTGARVEVAEVGRLFEVDEVGAGRLLVAMVGDDQPAAVLRHLDARGAVVAASKSGADQTELPHRQPARPHVARAADAVTLALPLHLLTHRLSTGNNV